MVWPSDWLHACRHCLIDLPGRVGAVQQRGAVGAGLHPQAHYLCRSMDCYHLQPCSGVAGDPIRPFSGGLLKVGGVENDGAIPAQERSDHPVGYPKDPGVLSVAVLRALKQGLTDVIGLHDGQGQVTPECTGEGGFPHCGQARKHHQHWAEGWLGQRLQALQYPLNVVVETEIDGSRVAYQRK